MANNKDFKVKNGIQPTVYHEAVGTVTSGSVGYNLSNTLLKSYTQAQSTSPGGVTFKPDGTKMYLSAVNKIFQYSLSTAWDVSTASYDSVSYTTNATGQTGDGISWAMRFNDDGTKMYVLGRQTDAVYEVDLSTAYDISTASYNSVSFSIASQETSPAAIHFKYDGTVMYVSGLSSDSVFQYTLSTAWDLSTASYASKTFSFATEDNTPLGLSFNSDGTTMYHMGGQYDAIYEYTLSTAWDVSTASYANVSHSVSSDTTTPYGLYLGDSGTKAYTVNGNSPYNIIEYDASKASNTLDLSTGSVFEITPTSDIQINLSNPADSGTVSQATLLLDGAATTTYSFSDLSDDSKSYAYTPEPNGIFFKPDGSKLFTMSNSAVAYQHTLTDPNDITTASYDSVSFSLASQDAGMSGLFFKSDGTKIYGVGSVTDTVYQYSLSTAWDLSTASYDSVSLSVSAQDSIPVRLFFKPDGTKMYVDGANGKKIFQYSLSTAWDLSTASYDSISYTYSSTLSYDLGQFFFTSDGTSLYFISAAVPSSAASEQVVGYSTLSTAWDISTIGVRSTFSISSLDTTPYGVQFSVDGVKLFVSGAQNDKVYQLNSSTGATITYPSTLEWPSGTAPTSPAIGDTDVLTFSTTDGGTSYQAVQAINGAK